MTPTQAEYHQKHKAFMAHIESRAVRPVPVVVAPVVAPKPEPELEAVKLPWFRMVGLVRPSIRDVQEAVAEHFGITRNDITSERRDMPVAQYRHIAVYLAKEMTGASYPLIARTFGRRDHTTAMHSYQKIRNVIESDYEMKADVESIRETIEAM